jgi:hypothetical protein
MKHFSIWETETGSKPIVHKRHCFPRQHSREARGQASVVARNIASEIESNVKTEKCEGHGSCFVETGFGKAAMAKGNFTIGWYVLATDSYLRICSLRSNQKISLEARKTVHLVNSFPLDYSE